MSGTFGHVPVGFLTRNLTLSGAYPRAEALVKATWNSDKGLLSQAGLEKVRGAETRRVVELQQRLGFSPATNGQLGWQDAFRPLIEENPAFEVGGLQRLFETNKFYRQPILRGPLAAQAGNLPASVLEGLEKTRTPWKANLPSPYWFGRATALENGQNQKDATFAIAAYLNAVARDLEDQGAKEIQFNEPDLFYQAQPDLDLAQAALNRALEGLHVPTTVAFPNGDAGPHFDWALKVPATTIGIDLIETSIEELPRKPIPLRLQAQIVDSQESRLETEEELVETVSTLESTLHPKGLVLTHTWDLDFVSDEVAQKKLQVLSTLVSPRKVVA